MSQYDDLLSEVFNSSPLAFIREFLRLQKRTAKKIRIGTTIPEVRANFLDALNASLVSVDDVRGWLRAVEGWGKQHLYLDKVPKRSLTHAHLLSEKALRAFLHRKRLLDTASPPDEQALRHVLTDVIVDDEVARLVWNAHTIARERHEELDEVRDLDDGDYVFEAYRLTPRRTSCQLLVRKTDGVVITLVDVPLGDEHDKVRTAMENVAKAILAPLSISIVFLAPVIEKLDESAVSARGPRPQRGLALGVTPTQARYLAEGARVDFSSTTASAGYTDSEVVRRTRKALQVDKVAGEAGKFRLAFQSDDGKEHVMVVSFDAKSNRAYLFSRMTEREVLALVDDLTVLTK
jgi:hypothetical protein